MLTTTLLQWGRGLVTTEMQGQGGPFMEPVPASMGPWPGDHGNDEFATEVYDAREQLQWGRGLVTTEMRFDSSSYVLPQSLQWGRGLVTTEISGTWTSRWQGPACFNGAVAW